MVTTTMPIIANMIVFGHSKDGDILLEPAQTCLCPECGKGLLKIRSRVRRHSRKEETGEKVWYQIPVGKCETCGRMCRMLPDSMVPYKHYEERVITKALNGHYPGKTIYLPSVQTIRRWTAWLGANKARIEGLFRSVGYRMLGFHEDLLFDTAPLLEKLRRDTDHWLQKIIRFIYNSGHHLQPA